VTVAELDVQRGLETVRRSIAHLRDRQPHAYAGAGADRLTVSQRARNASLTKLFGFGGGADLDEPGPDREQPQHSACPNRRLWSQNHSKPSVRCRAGQEPSAGDTRLALSPFCDRELIPGLRTDTDGIETHRRDPNTHVVGASGSSAALKS
jgi:hypothetical protein